MLSAVQSIWRRSSHKCSIKSKSYQSRRVRYFPALSCSQDPTVSQTELLAKQVPPPRCLALKVPRKGVRLSDRQNETSSSDHQHPHRQAPTCPGGGHSPLQTSATEMRPALPLHQCLYPEICSPFISPATANKMNHKLVTSERHFKNRINGVKVCAPLSV